MLSPRSRLGGEKGLVVRGGRYGSEQRTSKKRKRLRASMENEKERGFVLEGGGSPGGEKKNRAATKVRRRGGGG